MMTQESAADFWKAFSAITCSTLFLFVSYCRQPKAIKRRNPFSEGVFASFGKTTSSKGRL